MDVINEPRDGIRIGIRPDAVAKVEYMAGSASCVREHGINLHAQLLRRCKERSRIKIALNGFRCAQYLASRAEWAPPIHPDDINVELGDGLHQRRTLIGVVNDRNTQIAQASNRALHRRQSEAPELLDREQARPGFK